MFIRNYQHWYYHIKYKTKTRILSIFVYILYNVLLHKFANWENLFYDYPTKFFIVRSLTYINILKIIVEVFLFICYLFLTIYDIFC